MMDSTSRKKKLDKQEEVEMKLVPDKEAK